MDSITAMRRSAPIIRRTTRADQNVKHLIHLAILATTEATA